ncbi:hypothetical protein FD723_40285 (plasmid) [Nostoc sp. C052]|uniref:hypothetical protein n=1 Tax=Nostoc sp. C052 TaxID=2576902 RepID=UPI0015C3ADCA|nr:hypothetical protein [Nostoc sp. C052]QLE46453.1 hypothetical protein FD723_40285 [Nostoc sp. C052]
MNNILAQEYTANLYSSLHVGSGVYVDNPASPVIRILLSNSNILIQQRNAEQAIANATKIANAIARANLTSLEDMLIYINNVALAKGHPSFLAESID